MSLALYRRYRPESFADVVGQEHVTEPLMQALRTGRVNHAYLFSGPRGCGKTTSARILARCLNCEQGPTERPCGVCPSCRDLARGGPGSLDVIEIDAASHGGVDDARDLRERVTMSPVRDRYRVYIIDEAHMVSTQGFNALLKVVEEPPEHVKFVFATTEPDKVLQTIRSRTHHYSFRLVPPDVLVNYLASLCEQEDVPVGQGVLPLVVRAGQGSVRDSLSVLDQLIAGAGQDGLSYATAVPLLGYTDSALLDDVIDALGAADGASLFGVVNRVIESGHDPRRFVDDVLERLRDLILIQAMGPAADGVLRAVPPDQLERMRNQAGVLGAAELSRAADITNLALAEMVGASSPRMHLELLCARLLLPAADSDRGIGSRLERVERRLSEAPMAADSPQARPAEPRQPQSRRQQYAANVPPELAQPEPARSEPAGEPAATVRPETRLQARPAEHPSAGPKSGTGELDTERLRHSWNELLALIERNRRATWMVLQRGAAVQEVADGVVRIGFSDQGTAKGFAQGRHIGVVEQAIQQLFGQSLRVEVGQGGPRPPVPPISPATGSPPSAAPQETGPDRPQQARAPRPQQSTAPNQAQRPPARPAQTASPPARPAPARPRQVSDVDAWGVPFGDEPPAEEPPPDDWPQPVTPGGSSRRPADGSPEPTQTTPAPAQPVQKSEPVPESQPVQKTERAQAPEPARSPEPPVAGVRAESVLAESVLAESVRDDAPPAPEPEPPAQPVATAAPDQPQARLSRYELMARERSKSARPEAATQVIDDQPSVDDPDAEDSGLVGQPVVEQMLGGTVIDVHEG